MASSTSINTPTITPDQWSKFQQAQLRTQSFLRAPSGPMGKTFVLLFQQAYNLALPAIKTIIAARGGDPKALANTPMGTPIKEDGLWGPQTAWSMGIVLLFSFPAKDAQNAVVDLVTANLLKTRTGDPLPRNKIPAFATKYKTDISNMVWSDYASAVTSAQKPTTSQAAATNTVTKASASASSTTTTVAPPSAPAAPVVQAMPPVDVTGQVAPDTSYGWVWWLLGAGTLGGGLWWMFGRKGRR